MARKNRSTSTRLRDHEVIELDLMDEIINAKVRRSVNYREAATDG